MASIRRAAGSEPGVVAHDGLRQDDVQVGEPAAGRWQRAGRILVQLARDRDTETGQNAGVFVLGWNVTMEDGRTVLGNIEIKERFLIVNVNSAARAERAIAMLRAALGGLVAAPLTQIQTVEQMPSGTC
jgi:hypothetical protein